MILLATFLAAYPAGQSFSCTPAEVWDGDTFNCAEGAKVRVSGIDARELKIIDGRPMDAGCGVGHPCAAIDAVTSREYLARLLGGSYGVGPHGHLLVSGPPLTCVSAGSAGGKRTAAWCSAPKVGDLSCRMVLRGYAMRWNRYWRGHRC